VARRTLFRYFPTKASAAWPDQEARIVLFESMLEKARVGSDPFEAVLKACLQMAGVFQEHREDLVAQQRIIHSSHALIARQSEFDATWQRAIQVTLLGSAKPTDEVAMRLARSFAGAVMGVVRATYDAWVNAEPAGDLTAEGAHALGWLRCAWREASAAPEIPPIP